MSAMARTALVTTKGRTTRERILGIAARLMHEHGVAATSTPRLRAAANVSSSQIYHYFRDKDALTAAVIEHQTGQVIAAQRASLARADSLEDLNAWRDDVIAAAQASGGRFGCPLGSLAAELADEHPWARQAVADAFGEWAHVLQAALDRIVVAGDLRPDTDTRAGALALLAAVQGGLLLAQASGSAEALRAALDIVITHLATASGPLTYRS